MLSALPVGQLHLRVIPDRLRDPAFQIVDHQPLRDAPKKLQRIAVAAQPGFYFLVKDKFDIRIPAPPKHDHKRPGFAQVACLVSQHARIPEIHFGFFARLAFLADIDFDQLRFKLPGQPQHGSIAALVPLFFQSVKDRVTFTFSFSNSLIRMR